MITTSIQNPGLFKINDEITQEIHYGCNQEWYRKKWQRLSGCGPTAVTNIIYYLNRTRFGSESDHSTLTKSNCLILMEEIWRYVTPTLRGIPSTKMLYDDVLDYANAKALNIQLKMFDIPDRRYSRPEMQLLLTFLDEALSNNAPVAFLNLNNGDEKKLDSWHWVTIISLDYEEDAGAAFANILDEGVIKRIDLAQWFQTTTLGGGFVSFNLASSNVLLNP